MPLTPCITPLLPISDFSHSCIDRPFCASLVLLAFRVCTSSDSRVFLLSASCDTTTAQNVGLLMPLGAIHSQGGKAS